MITESLQRKIDYSIKVMQKAEHLVLNAKGDCVEVVHLCQYTGLKDKMRHFMSGARIMYN